MGLPSIEFCSLHNYAVVLIKMGFYYDKNVQMFKYSLGLTFPHVGARTYYI